MLCRIKKWADRTQLIQSGKKDAYFSGGHRDVPGSPRNVCHTQDAKMLRKAKINSKAYEVGVFKVLSNLVIN